MLAATLHHTPALRRGRTGGGGGRVESETDAGNEMEAAVGMGTAPETEKGARDVKKECGGRRLSCYWKPSTRTHTHTRTHTRTLSVVTY